MNWKLEFKGKADGSKIVGSRDRLDEMVGLYPAGRVAEGGTGRNDRVVLSIAKKYRCGNATWNSTGRLASTIGTVSRADTTRGLLLQVVYQSIKMIC
jgi:hypothetical protein